ncbi:MAG: MFS transporter, partial [Alphaproteobacteria bacterium]
AGAMAVTRLAGDWLATRFGPVRIVVVSCLAAAIGMGLFAAAPNLTVALIGAAFAGAGVATVYPLAMSAAAALPSSTGQTSGGASAEDNVAAVAFISFTAFLMAPPIIGGVAELSSLRWALGLLVLAVLVPLTLARAIEPATGGAEQ